jgi:protein TonB
VAPPAAPPAPPKIVLPSSDADYLHNPKPLYPKMSVKLGEQGTVRILVFVGADGSAQKVEIQKTSGYDRLDQAALAAIRHWRFVPGKRDGVPEAASLIVPMPFVLE